MILLCAGCGRELSFTEFEASVTETPTCPPCITLRAAAREF